MKKLLALLLLVSLLPMLTACSRGAALFSGLLAGVIITEALHDHHHHHSKVVVVEEHHYHGHHHCYD